MAKEKVKVGDIAIAAIRAGKSNEEALAAVHKALPDSETKMASVAWYRNKLREEGEKVPTARELKKTRRARDPLED